MEYALCLESGPHKKKTMVHILDLPGCIARGDTTESALENTPSAIRAYLIFCHKHGEAVDPDAPFTILIAQHVTKGSWLAQGDPTGGFSTDFEPLPEEELVDGFRRLDWLLDAILETAQRTPLDLWTVEPVAGGRPIYSILEHLAEAQVYYLRYLVGKVTGLNESYKGVQASSSTASAAVRELWNISIARMRQLTPEERAMKVPHGRVTWTAHRALRRMLEHAWEHYQELLERAKGI